VHAINGWVEKNASGFHSNEVPLGSKSRAEFFDKKGSANGADMNFKPYWMQGLKEWGEPIDSLDRMKEIIDKYLDSKARGDVAAGHGVIAKRIERDFLPLPPKLAEGAYEWLDNMRTIMRERARGRR